MIRALGAAVLVLATVPANAAENRRSGPPYAAPAPVVGYSWSGPYLGVNLGYLWSSIDNLGMKPAGITGGAQAGYNWQLGQVVFGGEADIQGSGAEDTFAPYKFSNPWFGSVRGRIGYAPSNLLLYATAGLAFGGGKLQIPGLSETHTHLGWTGGGGIEMGLTASWSAKAEYLFITLSDQTYVLAGPSSGLESHLVRIGLNYRF